MQKCVFCVVNHSPTDSHDDSVVGTQVDQAVPFTDKVTIGSSVGVQAGDRIELGISVRNTVVNPPASGDTEEFVGLFMTGLPGILGKGGEIKASITEIPAMTVTMHVLEVDAGGGGAVVRVPFIDSEGQQAFVQQIATDFTGDVDVQAAHCWNTGQVGAGSTAEMAIVTVEVWREVSEADEKVAMHSEDGSIGDFIRRMTGLRQQNMRVVYTAWNSNKQPTAGSVLIYDSAPDANADTGPGWALATGRYDFTQAFDAEGRPTEYVSTKSS